MDEPKETDKSSSSSVDENKKVNEQSQEGDHPEVNGTRILESSEESFKEIGDSSQTPLVEVHFSDASLNSIKSPKSRDLERGNSPNSKSENAGDSGEDKLVSRSLVDTAAPFESVKEAVSKFGGIIDWKAHKSLVIERQKELQDELEKTAAAIPEFKQKSAAAERAKMEVLKELEITKSAIEELKLSLESSQREEARARQDSELAQLQAAQLAQGIVAEAGTAAKAQLDVAQARHAAAESELAAAKEELEAMKAQLFALVREREAAEDRAAAAEFAAGEAEKAAEELTMELIMAKEALEAAQAAHLEAEEHRIGASMARDQDLFNWERELKQAQDEVDSLGQQLSQARELKSTLESASESLAGLKGELSEYMASAESTADVGNHSSVQTVVAAMKKELEEVKGSIEKARGEVDFLKVASASLVAELEKEKAALSPMKQREGMALVAVSSLEMELERVNGEIEMARSKEREAREEMVELPKALQKAAMEVDEAKSTALAAQEELRKVKEEFDQVKASVSTVESRLLAAMKEIEAAKATERLALAAVRALQEGEQAAVMETGGGSGVIGGSSPGRASVTLPLDEYLILSKTAREAEELASEKLSAAISQIEVAKASETKSMENLAAVIAELEAKKEALKAATEKAEKAKEGKLAAEQELRTWRAEHEQKRRNSSVTRVAAVATAGASPSRHSPPRVVQENSQSKLVVAPVTLARTPSPPRQRRPVNEKVLGKEGKGETAASAPPSPALETKARKKKSIFPHLSKFLGKKKA